MKRKKYKPKEGDLFRYLISDGKVNNGFTIYGYGRVLNSTTVAFYSNDAHPPRKVDSVATTEQVLALDVAFIVGCTYDGFDSGMYEVIENIELEEKFKKPIYFYHRSVGENQCNVFNVWDNNDSYSVDIKDLPVYIERWRAYSHVHVEKRLGIYRG